MSGAIRWIYGIDMAIKSLDGIINSDFVYKLARVSDDSSATAAASGKAKMEGQALYASLRSGAKNFAAGVQLLNRGISLVNISLDVNDKLLSLVKDLRTIVDKANRGNVSASAARHYRLDFDARAQEFDDIIEGSKKNESDVLDVTTMEGALLQAGLDKTKLSELATMLKRISSPTDRVLDSEGNVTSDGNPIPVVDFARSLKAAIYDEDDPGDDKSGFFGKAKTKLHELELRLEENVKALRKTQELVKENLDLARVTGVAFLNVSDEMTGSESVDQVLDLIRSKIRSSAPAALGQVHNLERVLAAGLASLTGQDSGT